MWSTITYLNLQIHSASLIHSRYSLVMRSPPCLGCGLMGCPMAAVAGVKRGVVSLWMTAERLELQDWDMRNGISTERMILFLQRSRAGMRAEKTKESGYHNTCWSCVVIALIYLIPVTCYLWEIISFLGTFSFGKLINFCRLSNYW